MNVLASPPLDMAVPSATSKIATDERLRSRRVRRRLTTLDQAAQESKDPRAGQPYLWSRRTQAKKDSEWGQKDVTEERKPEWNAGKVSSWSAHPR